MLDTRDCHPALTKPERPRGIVAPPTRSEANDSSMAVRGSSLVRTRERSTFHFTRCNSDIDGSSSDEEDEEGKLSLFDDGRCAWENSKSSSSRIVRMA